jgi:SAM-dependent methyltransferase
LIIGDRETSLMRLQTISRTKAALSNTTQVLLSEDISHYINEDFLLIPNTSFKRKIIRLLAPHALRLQQAKAQKLLGCEVPFHFTLLSYGERFAHDASLSALLKLTRSDTINNVLIPGCYLASEDVQFWLRQGVRRLEGIDVHSLQAIWAYILPKLRVRYNAEINFRQASIESLPFEDGMFDLIASSAVLEHVRNIEEMTKETARILRPGGWAWHDFGPLYYSYGGDHCSAAYGNMAGYDHLLMNEEEYQKRINDQSFFDQQIDPNLPFWALRNQFSFATALEYVLAFEKKFEIRHLVIKLNEEGILFRQLHAERWNQLLTAGVSEIDLLIKSLAVVLRKKS